MAVNIRQVPTKILLSSGISPIQHQAPNSLNPQVDRKSHPNNQKDTHQMQGNQFWSLPCTPHTQDDDKSQQHFPRSSPVQQKAKNDISQIDAAYTDRHS